MICLIVVLSAFRSSNQYVSLRQPCEFALHRSRTQPDAIDDLLLQKPPIGLAEEQAQYGLPGSPIQCFTDGANEFPLTHYGFYSTQNGYLVQVCMPVLAMRPAAYFQIPFLLGLQPGCTIYGLAAGLRFLFASLSRRLHKSRDILPLRRLYSCFA